MHNRSGIPKLAVITAFAVFVTGSMLAQATSAGPSSLGAASIAVGYDTACAVTNVGSVTCWGSQSGSGALGNDIEAGWTTRPVKTHVLDELSVIVLDSGGDGNHTCAITTSSGVYCWGYNKFGQLGDGSTTDRHVPVPVCADSNCTNDLTDIQAISVGVNSGGQFSCALTNTSTVLCWGKNANRELGADTIETCTHSGNTKDCSTIPVQVVGISNASLVDAGGRHACAIVDTDAVSCWGSSLQGQLGDGSETAENAPVTPTGLGQDVTAVASGFAHTCALLDDTTVKCWGDGRFGQLGVGDPDDLPEFCENPINPAWVEVQCTLTPVSVCDTEPSPEPSLPSAPCSAADGNVLTGVVALSAGFYHTCALMDDGSLKCWGQSEAGQLGDGNLCVPQPPIPPGQDCDLRTPDDEFIEIYPVDVLNLTDIEEVSAGYHSTCARTSTDVWCWGENHRGALGNGTDDDTGTPVEVLFDTDRDGCHDDAEGTLGRDNLDPWDYYDVVNSEGEKESDGVIDLLNDALSVINHFSPGGLPPYDVHFDRGPRPPPPPTTQPWEMTAPDGYIDLLNDIQGVIAQIGATCG